PLHVFMLSCFPVKIPFIESTAEYSAACSGDECRQTLFDEARKGRKEDSHHIGLFMSSCFHVFLSKFGSFEK
ncbi:MAG: hypothetical protein LV480_02910, partial [Methylacidiphilales bacterium]|nr:hypothetical protein [Candidatus Methylacidiphilales bacterium]